MGKLIEQGSFQTYADVRLNEARSTINEYSLYTRKTTVFISHKHDELQDLKGVLGFLQKQYDVKVYIDSQDPSMPKITTATTAANLKARIKKCDKFILLATNAAIDSMFSSWELRCSIVRPIPPYAQQAHSRHRDTSCSARNNKQSYPAVFIKSI